MNNYDNLCSVGIMLHNEEANIMLHLHSLVNQRLDSCIIDEIIVISSGCTDRTEDIVRRFSQRDPRIKLIIQKQRLGKATAINPFLRIAKNKICFLVNGDTILDRDAIEYLFRPFLNHTHNVGMTGAQLIPLNGSNTFIAHVCKFMWKLHHKISLICPKMGEVVAFRRDIVGRIPASASVDEVCIESAVIKRGYKLVYIPDSKVYIRIPDTVGDFIKQRRRIATGHIWAARNLRYTPSTRNKWLTLRLTLYDIRECPKDILFILGAVILECLSRFMGLYDYYIRKKNYYIWEIAKSTKTSLKITDRLKIKSITEYFADGRCFREDQRRY